MQVGTLNSLSYSAAVARVKVSVQRTTDISLTITTVTALRYAISKTGNVRTTVTLWSISVMFIPLRLS
jgi:hypothetical protein